MAGRILITGGAGFIGSHLADELLAHGYQVRALDNLSPQVHGEQAERPDYLHPDVELICGDIRDAQAVEEALEDVSAVFHLAAAVGVGQSMYRIADYVETNDLGTAYLLEALLRRGVERLVVASSMSIYGEGLYRDEDGNLHPQAWRSLRQLQAGDWELRDQQGRPLKPVPTPESKPPCLASIYAMSKHDQETMCRVIGQAYDIPTVGLRFFNVYGPRQALSNPYTGVLAIFASRLLNDRQPLIFEDGQQQRDFVSVHDVARACRLALEVPEAAGEVFNVGSGQRQTILDLAGRMARAVGKEHIQPEITGEYRAGDIRHCVADITHARELLGYQPKVAMEDGMRELTDWLGGQIAEDRVCQARAELQQRGLTV